MLAYKTVNQGESLAASISILTQQHVLLLHTQIVDLWFMVLIYEGLNAMQSGGRAKVAAMLITSPHIIREHGTLTLSFVHWPIVSYMY